jgi:hypothetical protein
MRRALVSYRRKFCKELYNLKCTDPKAYWNKINPRARKTEPKVSVEQFFEHFRDLNVDNVQEPVNGDQDANNLLENMGVSNEVLDAPITEIEIRKVFSKLKTNKAHGVDNITNEFLKNTLGVLMPVWLSLFNKVLNTGWWDIFYPFIKRVTRPSQRTIGELHYLVVWAKRSLGY